jgi:hypothetical protein
MARLSVHRIPFRIYNRLKLHFFAAFVQVNQHEILMREARLVAFRNIASHKRKVFSTWVWWLRFVRDVRADHAEAALQNSSLKSMVRMKIGLRVLSSESSLWDFAGSGQLILRILREFSQDGSKTTRNMVSTVVCYH